MQTVASTAADNRPARSTRPEVSVYWRPGCSSCLKTKEFMEENGIDFESVNVEADPEAMKELMGAGLRSVPVVRRGQRYIYAQSMEDVAQLVEVTRAHERLPQDELLDRWEKILDHARRIVSGFDDELIARCAITGRSVRSRTWPPTSSRFRRRSSGRSTISPSMRARWGHCRGGTSAPVPT